MGTDFDTRTCPKCGLATARVTRGLVLCAACGAITPAPPAEPWMLEWRARELRGAVEEPLVPRRKLVARGAGVVVLVVGTIISGLALAFRAYGSVNVRYLAALAVLLTMVGAATVAALAWATADPNTPLKDADRRRLRDVERALDDAGGCDDPGADGL